MVKQVQQLYTGYPQSEEWVEDDRVLCQNCSNAVKQRQRISMTTDQFEKLRKNNHTASHWMFEEVKIKDNWATVLWDEQQCSQTSLATFPVNIKHRCTMFQTKPSAVEFAEWWIT